MENIPGFILEVNSRNPFHTADEVRKSKEILSGFEGLSQKDTFSIFFQKNIGLRNCTHLKESSFSK